LKEEPKEGQNTVLKDPKNNKVYLTRK